MTLAPKDYITERRREISQRMQSLRDELGLLDKMESALGDSVLTPLPAAVQIPRPDGVAPKPRMRFEQGIKGMVLAVLDDAGAVGLSAMQMLIEIKKTFGYELPRTSLSPQLTRLKRSELIGSSNGIWLITSKGREALK